MYTVYMMIGFKSEIGFAPIHVHFERETGRTSMIKLKKPTGC